MSAADKLDKPAPHALLALDGGGIRGMITLEILSAIERMLQSALGRDDATSAIDVRPMQIAAEGAMFPMRAASKSSLYRNEVTDAAEQAVLLAVERFATHTFRPVPLTQAHVRGQARRLMTQDERRIDWACDKIEVILRKIRAADGTPVDRVLNQAKQGVGEADDGDDDGDVPAARMHRETIAHEKLQPGEEIAAFPHARHPGRFLRECGGQPWSLRHHDGP